MRNVPLKGFLKKSPLKQNVDTTLADKVYSRTRVNEDLVKKGLHTEKNLRGNVNTSPGNEDEGVNNMMIDTTA